MRQRHDTPWKINASFLDSEDFIEETMHALERVCWENYKTVFRDSARMLGLRKSDEDQQARVHLTDTLKTLLEEERSPGSFGKDIRYREELFWPSWKSGTGGQ